MIIEELLSKIKRNFGLKLSKPIKNDNDELKIDQEFDLDYEVVKIHQVGLADPFALQGIIILKTDDGKEFPISAFSGEVARYISNFLEEKQDYFPTIYNMIEQICEESEILLVKIKLYFSGNALRANLYFDGKKDIVLRNFRASDALALATFYRAPILIRKELLTEKVIAK